ncbi:MAG: hypothetical protein M1814_003371 [Vezdaea aestivalis]|nr:MAG: hypothetical protein M1814_003371 [Vezdaea aestivalis]
MASALPAKLRTPEISQYTLRASQIEKAKPVIAYWCSYWIVNHILSKGLHTIDAECRQYTADVMDKLEKVKAANPGNDAIIDDMAGQAYVEQFALEVFQRADNAIQANVVSKQTADTFRASATFLELLQIWGTPEQEIVAKIKYAKFHAVRIAKAVQAGEDPNKSNPHPESVVLSPSALPTDIVTASPAPTDFQPPNQPDHPFRQGTVEDVVEERHTHYQPTPSPALLQPQSHSPPLVPTPPNGPSDADAYYHTAGPGSDVSPLEPEPDTQNQAPGTGGGSYFPNVPVSAAHGSAPPSAPPSSNFIPTPPSGPATYSTHPSAPPPHGSSYIQTSTGLVSSPPAAPVQHSPSSAPPSASPYSPHPPTDTAKFPPGFPGSQATRPLWTPPQPPQPSAIQPQHLQPQPQPQVPHFQQQPQSSYIHNPNAPRPFQQLTVPAAVSVPTPPVVVPIVPPSQVVARPVGPEMYNSDEEAVMKAQKHARWAISALNFEDSRTAVKELRNALAVLGAR